MDRNTQKWYGIAAAIIVIFVATAWYLSAHKDAIAPSTQNTATTTNATSTGQTGQGGIQVTGVVDTSGIPAPDLNRPYTPPSYLPAAQKQASVAAYADVVSHLKFDPTNHAYWLQLAIYRKAAGDYTGAETVCLFVTKRWSNDPIPYHNLADLYENYLHDNVKAKAILQAGLKANPGNADLQAMLDGLQ